jgi:divalent metal cation (Fe/Co/Zn/Cd) transporter
MNMTDTKRLWKTALWLAGVTVFYNLAEGLVSVVFGYTDDALTLFGFGLDSFIEVISGLGIWHMVTRVQKNDTRRDAFERTALRITSIAFYILAAGLSATSIYNIFYTNQPSTTVWGIIISLVSIITMTLLMSLKMSVGKRLNSQAIIADAHCTRTCLILSIILLLSSVVFELFRVGFIDSLGALGIAYYAFQEGREAAMKAKKIPLNSE